MEGIQMADTSPEMLILANAPALHSLKRPQLLGLCKQFGLKGNGKNIDLIARLQAYGNQLDSQKDQGSKDEGEVEDVEDAEMKDEEARTSMRQSICTPGDVGLVASYSTTPLKDRSGSTLVSALRSASRSIIHNVQRRLESPSSAARSMNQALVDGVEYDGQAIPSIYPTITHLLSPSPKLPVVRRVSSIGSLQRTNAAAISDNCFGQLDAQMQDAESTCTGETVSLPTDLPIPKGTTRLGKLAPPSTPLKSAPAMPFVFGSPASGKKDFTFTAPMTMISFKDSTLSSSSNETCSHKSAAERVLEEMTTRTLQKLGGSLSSSISLSTGLALSGSSGSGGSDEMPSLVNKKLVTVTDPFEGKHRKVFDKMDSIATHYAAKRSASSSNINGVLKRSTSTRSVSGRSTAEPKPSKRPRLASSTSSGPCSAKDVSPVVKPDLKQQSTTARTNTSSAVSGGAAVQPAARDAKSQLDMTKARRKSKSRMSTTLGSRRKSFVIGRTPKPFESHRPFKSTFNKSAVKLVDTEAMTKGPMGKHVVVPKPKVTLVSGSTSGSSNPLSSSGPVPTGTHHRLHPSQVPQRQQQQPSKTGPAWKKFDLQASLAKPLPYIPKIGPQYRPNSGVTATKGFSSVPGRRPVIDTIKPNVTLTSTSSCKTNLEKKRLSSRVANPDLLSTISPSAPPPPPSHQPKSDTHYSMDMTSRRSTNATNPTPTPSTCIQTVHHDENQPPNLLASSH